MYKPYADSTLMHMTKKQIIEQLRVAEYNFSVAEQSLTQQYENVKDFVPVVYARWIKSMNESPDPRVPSRVFYKCSKCGALEIFKVPYCSNCGAKMDECAMHDAKKKVLSIIENAPVASAVPVKHLIDLRDKLYEEDLITMRGLSMLNNLISVENES